MHTHALKHKLRVEIHAVQIELGKETFWYNYSISLYCICCRTMINCSIVAKIQRIKLYCARHLFPCFLLISPRTLHVLYSIKGEGAALSNISHVCLLLSEFS